MGFFSIEELGFGGNKEPTGKHHFIEKKKEEWKWQALHSIAFEIDPQHTLILTTPKACGIYYTYVPQHTIPFRSFRVSRAYHSSQIIHTLVVTTCALYDILLLRITSSSSLAPPLPPSLPPTSFLASTSLASDPSPAIYLLANDDGVCGLPFSMFHIHGVWTRTTGIGLLFLSFYFALSILFFSFFLFLLRRLFTLPYYFGMFHFLVWFGLVLVLVFSLVSMLVWSRSRWTVRVACLSGWEADWRVYCGREAMKDTHGLVGWVGWFVSCVMW